MANNERLHAVLDHIKTLPDAVKLNLSGNEGEPMWDQHKWIALPPNTMTEGSCGTSGCFAGWAVMMFVPEFELDLPDEDWGREMVDNVIINGESTPIEQKARELLELNMFEADALFDFDNDLLAIATVIGKIEAGIYDPEFGEAEVDDATDL